jgi:hypothetical protein
MAIILSNGFAARQQRDNESPFYMKNNYKPVSRILFSACAKWLSFICSTGCPEDSSCLPCTMPARRQSRAGRPQWYYMWHFSMQGLPAVDVTINGRGLLPRVFTLTPSMKPEQLFSVALSLIRHCCRMAGSSPVHRPVLSGLSSPCLRRKRQPGL